jgi:phage FluMu gp28-like protein
MPFVKIDSDSLLAQYFTSYQICWIQAEDPFHAAKKQVCAFAEKSVRIGWTFCDGFKNVRKRLRFPNRDYLFVTKDYPSALEYMNHVYDFADMFGFTRAVLSHGEDIVKVKSLGPDGRPTSLTEEVRIGYIKFDNGSRIIAFSSHPHAMAVYGGDVGLDEFAKHPNAQLLWQTAQSRVTWAYDIAVWSSHDGEDTLFNQFAQQARALSPSSSTPPGESPTCNLQPATFNSDLPPAGSPTHSLTPSGSDPVTCHSSPVTSPWNLYFKVTIVDAIELGLLDVINRTQDSSLAPNQFLADCRSRAGSDEIFEQSYMCNPLGAAANHIVDWSAIERCRYDYEIERVHLEADDVRQRFGEFNPSRQDARESQIEDFIRETFPKLFKMKKARLGFDVAASGQGDLAAFYIDEPGGSELWLRGLLTARTEDWNFLKTVLFYFLRKLHSVKGAGDESGLGRQICWEAAQQFSYKFLKVNFASKKHDLGFALMNQLSVAEKRFPKSEHDIAADFFALRKSHTGTRCVFSEGRNILNPHSHCDISWAGALATHAHIETSSHQVGAAVLTENGPVYYGDWRRPGQTPEKAMILSDDPAIWRPWR